jgi:hypothetical protein
MLIPAAMLACLCLAVAALFLWRNGAAVRCRARVRAAIREQQEYEPGHAQRQRDRLNGVRGGFRHGKYDSDQRAHSIVLKVRRACALAGEAPPADLTQRVVAELKEADRAEPLD